MTIRTTAFGGALCAAMLALPMIAKADDEANAVFKRASDFLVEQRTFAVTYDATLEIVTADLMKVGAASSGSLNVRRPDGIRAVRMGDLADVELVYDGKALSVYGKNLNIFAKYPLEGKIDDAIDALRGDFGLEMPAADLLSSNPYEVMMSNVVSSVALGTGVIGGQVCDHLAFRTAEVDWQLWVAEGDKPFPCRITITSKLTLHSPSYTIDFHEWKTGDDVAADEFTLKTATDAKEVDVTQISKLDDVWAPSGEGEAQ